MKKISEAMGAGENGYPPSVPSPAAASSSTTAQGAEVRSCPGITPLTPALQPSRRKRSSSVPQAHRAGRRSPGNLRHRPDPRALARVGTQVGQQPPALLSGVATGGQDREIAQPAGILERTDPERTTHRQRWGGTAAAVLPAPQAFEALHLLIPTAMAVGQQTELVFFQGQRAALHLHGRAEGAAITEIQQGPEAPAQTPGGPGHDPELKAQGQLPAGGVSPGRCPQRAQGGHPVVAGGGAPIGAGQVEHPAEAHGLQGQRQQRRRAAEGIEIHQLEALIAEQAIGQQLLGRVGTEPQRQALPQGLQIDPQQRQPLRIGIVGPDGGCTGLEAIAQGAHTAARHQIQHPQGALTRQPPGQQHPQIPGRARVGAEEAFPQPQLGRSFAIVRVVRRGSDSGGDSSSPACRRGWHRLGPAWHLALARPGLPLACAR